MKPDRYILIKTVKTPVVINTPYPHKPTAIRYKEFKEGTTVTGTVEHRGGKPAFLVVRRRFVIPISAVKLLVTKEVETSSNAAGNTKDEFEKFAKSGNPKVKYLDAALVGGLIGAAGVFFAQKKGWINPPDRKNLVYGALGTAAVAAYLVYRVRNRNAKK